MAGPACASCDAVFNLRRNATSSGPRSGRGSGPGLCRPGGSVSRSRRSRPGGSGVVLRPRCRSSPARSGAGPCSRRSRGPARSSGPAPGPGRVQVQSGRAVLVRVRRGPPVLVRLLLRRGHFRKQPRFFRPLHRAENFQRFSRRGILRARSKSCFLVY